MSHVSYVIGNYGDLPRPEDSGETFLVKFCPVCKCPVIGRDDDELGSYMFEHLKWAGAVVVDGEWQHHRGWEYG